MPVSFYLNKTFIKKKKKKLFLTITCTLTTHITKKRLCHLFGMYYTKLNNYIS